MQLKQQAVTFLLTGLLIATASQPSNAEEAWGNLKGQVVWSGGDYKPAPIDVNKDQGHCLSKGQLLDQKYVINPKNKGVRWVVVWLTDPANPNKKLPTHPALANVKGMKITIDQPCCMFEPRVLGIREGQILVAKNSAPIAHNVNVIGGDANPNLNQIIPPGGSLEIEGWKAARFPVQVSCSIHGWMKSYVRVFNHPYFAVTDENGNFEIKNAPAGKFNLVTWQEETGWVKGGRNGVPVEVKAGETTDLGKIDLQPSKN